MGWYSSMKHWLDFSSYGIHQIHCLIILSHFLRTDHWIWLVSTQEACWVYNRRLTWMAQLVLLYFVDQFSSWQCSPWNPSRFLELNVVCMFLQILARETYHVLISFSCFTLHLLSCRLDASSMSLLEFYLLRLLIYAFLNPYVLCCSFCYLLRSGNMIIYSAWTNVLVSKLKSISAKMKYSCFQNAYFSDLVLF